ncbi:hypothetical protein DOT_1764 [Desulfosporosinus sp. OT]|nr:hypothetical protein DOT_1764 [Desulfosporosinus sp. OT]
MGEEVEKVEKVGGSVLARSHTLHCYSLDDVAKTQNLQAVLHVNR